MVLAGLGLTGLTGAMVLLDRRLEFDDVLLLYLLGVVVVAIVVGRVTALVAAVVSVTFAMYFFAPRRGEVHYRWLELGIFLLVATLVGLVADAAERHRRELAAEQARNRQLAELERVRSGLLSAVSHDLRTPLAGIKANASALRYADDSWPDDLRLELLTSIEDSADQLSEMVSDVLALGRLRAGALQAELGPVAVYEVVARALATLGNQPAADVEPVVVEVAEDLPLVVADPSLLERVLANVVANALDHAAAGGTVTVRAAELAGGEEGGAVSRVRVSVVDHGPGIPEERWESAFEPFQRLTDSGGGIGLGLAVARGFCEAMGVNLVPAHTPGGGLTMTVVLDVAERETSWAAP